MATYNKYFDIDPTYFPFVNDNIILQEPDLWEKYYPHETFIKLINQTISVLNRAKKLNIWVEGAYGTGKSHAVLTLKHLLDANPNEIKEYFSKYNIDEDLYREFISAKQPLNGGGPLITVHRYGSSSIYSDEDLFFAMQESIDEALKKVGIENAGPNSLRNAIINYLSDDENKRSIEVYVTGTYKNIFGEKDIDTIVENLKDYTDESLKSLIRNILKLGRERNIKAFTIDASLMANWITEIIQDNKLKGIVFIWDEFTEYFLNNINRLTGFQSILELSAQIPFCFIPVTHMTTAFFDAKDNNRKKIIDRFVTPLEIELPQNMAFRLMGQAMRIKDDDSVKNEWNEVKKELYDRTQIAREKVKEYAKINDEELCNILPIHPYTACVLKQISSNFASNQRSMFDFIKDAEGEERKVERKGFQWYIRNFGPYEGDNPFLTIDLLWGFFYETGKKDLSESIRHLLEQYDRLEDILDEDEQRVLKTILILEAMSSQAGGSIEIYQPNEENLSNAFEGTDLGEGKAIQLANKLLGEKRISKEEIKEGKYIYSVLIREASNEETETLRKNYENYTTSKLIAEGELKDAIDLPKDLQLRFKGSYIGITDFAEKTKKLNSLASDNQLYFRILFCLSKNDEESFAMADRIQQFIKENPETELIFFDCGNPLGDEEFNNWVKYSTQALYFSDKNKKQSNTNEAWAKEVLLKWKGRIAQGKGTLYNKTIASGKILYNIGSLSEELRAIDCKRFRLSLECNFKSSDGWWLSNSLKIGVECGLTRTRKGTYNNNNANLENMLSFAWTCDKKYWLEQPTEPISQIKIKLEEFIHNQLDKDGRISILDIYTFLTNEPFGFLPCNMTAFFIGFLLKEYVNDTYSCSDGLTTNTMTSQKMSEIVEEVIKHQINSDTHYKNKFLVVMSLEEKTFINGTIEIFEIQKSSCTSVENTASQLRIAMKTNLSFPIWTIVEIADTLQIPSTLKTVIKQLILEYQELANNISTKADSDIARGIGKTFMNNPDATSALHENLTNDNCKKGMEHYLESYKGGELITLASKINNNAYLNDLKEKINADEATWLWKQETINQQIDRLILEYHIVEETKELLSSVTSYQDAIKEWKNKVSLVKLTYEHIKTSEVHISLLLSHLYNIYVDGSIKENMKQDFLEAIQVQGNDFITFYNNQFEIFKQLFNVQLQGLTDDNKKKIFNKLPTNTFAYNKVDYSQTLESIIEEYKKDLCSVRLRNLWKDKTQTDSPSVWSIKYKMPILAMLPDDKFPVYRTIFATINSSNPSDKQVNQALKELEKFTYWDDLSDKAKRDEAFREKILKEETILIDNIEELKDYVSNNSSEVPYHWMGNPQVEKLILNFVKVKYENQGWKKAIEKIENLSDEELKKQMEKLIKNNMSLGIQIIKSMN